MPEEPSTKRAVAFYDGQNLFHHAKAAFGHHYPNYDPLKLFNAICAENEWHQSGVRFYTGVPQSHKDPLWHGFWNNRLLAMRRAGIFVFHRPLKYQITYVENEEGDCDEVETPQEKGVDVRLALDVVRLARTDQFDVGVIFSQDQDLPEIAEEIRDISRSQNRWIKVCSAFPTSPSATANRGIDKTDWIRIGRALYDSCLDPRDYRPKKR